MIPNSFGDSLEQFAKAFAGKDSDGVFRYEPQRADSETRAMAGEDDSTDQWFDTSTDPELARALAEARAVANKHVDDPDPTNAFDETAMQSETPQVAKPEEYKAIESHDE